MTTDDNTGDYRASCCYCGSLGNYTSNRDAANAELHHQLNKHPVQLQGATGNASSKNAGFKTERYGITGKLKKEKKPRK